MNGKIEKRAAEGMEDASLRSADMETGGRLAGAVVCEPVIWASRGQGGTP